MFERHTRAEQIPVPARGFARNHDRNDCTEAHFTVTLAECLPELAIEEVPPREVGNRQCVAIRIRIVARPGRQRNQG
jgi:hypothetical protein